ncbi:hypothetical protein Cadr_000011593 [Camelus dromedarius]|uniref:Uncharacterized protein n=1 Tax=Camelus dromedarius TaxID=9838 RepID=A0A5N4DUF4_CAMDR|nr:hypothetical protein Cadr_000011593 [Camelus dromedarius]
MFVGDRLEWGCADRLKHSRLFSLGNTPRPAFPLEPTDVTI